MSTGSVNPFTPSQPTQSATPSASANSLMTFNQCDALLVYNSGTVDITLALFPATDEAVTGTPITNGMPIPKGTRQLVGVAGVAGSNPQLQVALLSVTGTAGTIYVTPGLGTQY